VIIGICGNEGSGKTLLGTILCYKYKKKGYKIISNLESLKIRDYTLNDIPEIVNNFDRKYIHTNFILFIDEVYKYDLDSRRGFKSENIDNTYFALQLRKFNINLIWTAQYFMSVDVRVRNVTNYYYYPNLVKKNEIYLLNIAKVRPQDLSILSNKTIIIKNYKFFFNLYKTREYIKGGELIGKSINKRESNIKGKRIKRSEKMA
jgi:hypothetical protein